MIAKERNSPKRAAKAQRILAAALKVFAKKGYAGTSMDEIATAAKVSKPTLYTYFGSKDQLFEALMVAQRDDMLQPFEHGSKNLVQDLHTFAWAYADVVMKPEFLSLARLVIGEAQRFPTIGKTYQAAGPDRVLRGMMAYLEQRRKQGLLAFEDAELAAQDLWSLILSAPRNEALHRPDAVPGRQAIERSINNGLAVFIRAYSTKPATDTQTLKRLVSKATKERTA